MDEGRVLTCVCMLGYWMWDAVPIWFLYASVLIVGHCADLVSVCFGVDCGTLCRSGSCMLRYWLWSVVPIFSYMLCFFVTGQDVHSLLLSALCG